MNIPISSVICSELMIICISEYSRLVVIIEYDPAVQGLDHLPVTCYFKTQHVHCN